MDQAVRPRPQKTVQDRALDQQLALIKQFSPKDYEELSELLLQIDDAEQVEKSRTHFMEFVKAMWPGFISGNHHKIMAEIIEGIVSGKKKR